MPVALVVVLVAVAASGGVWALSRSPVGPDPIDPAREERWLVGWLLRHSRLGATARSIDRKVAGGLMLVVALATVFVTAFVVGILFDMVDRDSGLAVWDRAVAEWGSRKATGWSTTLLDVLTDLGGSAYLAAVFAAVAIWDFRRKRNANVVVFLLVVLVGVVLINNGLKLIVDRDRPDVAHLVGTSGSSFPSGHSAAAAAGWFALALVVARHWSRRGRAAAAAIATVIAIAVAASRALLGVHWLTDVIAGVVVGWGWFLLSALAFGGRLQRLGAPAEVATVELVHAAAADRELESSAAPTTTARRTATTRVTPPRP
jgi:membrane-associated phospholipid phosphatase